MAEFPAEFPISFGGDGAPSVYGFEVALFTGADPELAANRVRTIECDPFMRDAVIAVSAGPVAKTIRAAVRALYLDGARSPWRVSNPDVVEANTLAVPTKDDLRQPLNLNGRKVWTDPTPPTSGMVKDDLWFDTTPIEAGRLRYTPYIYDGAGWVPYDGPPIVVSGLAAFGSVVTASLAAEAVTADKVNIEDLIAAFVTVGLLKTANYAEDGSGNPTAGAKLDKDGTALKVAPDNLQIGASTFTEMFAGAKFVKHGRVYHAASYGFTPVALGCTATIVSFEWDAGQFINAVRLEFAPGFPGLPYVVSTPFTVNNSNSHDTVKLGPSQTWGAHIGILDGNRTLRHANEIDWGFDFIAIGRDA